MGGADVNIPYRLQGTPSRHYEVYILEDTSRRGAQTLTGPRQEGYHDFYNRNTFEKWLKFGK